jgi:hypothetical protein
LFVTFEVATWAFFSRLTLVLLSFFYDRYLLGSKTVRFFRITANVVMTVTKNATVKGSGTYLALSGLAFTTML